MWGMIFGEWGGGDRVLGSLGGCGQGGFDGVGGVGSVDCKW